MLNNFLNRFRFLSKGVQNVSISWFLFIIVCVKEREKCKPKGRKTDRQVIIVPSPKAG